MAAYNCPVCRAAIPLEDVNVAADLALCRACGKTCSFAMLSGSSEISLDCLAHPPRGIRVEKDYREGTTVIYRKLSPTLLFLIPFTAVWAGGSMWGIYGQQFRKGVFDAGQSLFGIPFLIGSIVLLTVIVFMLAGKWAINLNKGQGSVFMGVGALGWTRRFVCKRDTLVSLTLTSFRVNNVAQKGILVRTDGQDLVFGATLSEDAKQYIAAFIKKYASET